MEPGDLGIDGEAGVLVNAAVVFVETQGRGAERARGEITADVFIRDNVQFGVRLEGGSWLGSG
jgi:hypothetical protein